MPATPQHESARTRRDGSADGDSVASAGTHHAHALVRAGYEGAITVEVGAPNPDGVAADGKALLVEHLLAATHQVSPGDRS